MCIKYNHFGASSTSYFRVFHTHCGKLFINKIDFYSLIPQYFDYLCHEAKEMAISHTYSIKHITKNGKESKWTDSYDETVFYAEGKTS